VRPSRIVNGRRTAAGLDEDVSPTSVLAGLRRGRRREERGGAPGRAHGSVGATSAWNFGRTAERAEVVVPRAWSGSRVAWDGDFSALSAARVPARAWARRGSTGPLVAGVDLEGLLEVADGVGEVPPVVEDDAVDWRTPRTPGPAGRRPRSHMTR